MKQRQIEVLDFLLDDHFALWDLADTFPLFWPDAPNSANGELLELIRSGYLALTYGKVFENQTEAIPDDEVDEPLRDPANWHPSGMSPSYALELTELGREHLRSLGFGPPEG